MKAIDLHNSYRNTIVIFIVALFPWIVYAIQGNMGISLWDEGYLWYGTQRLLLGEVPIRDFIAYDIGRYCWAAGIMKLLGSNGILALRISNAALQSLTLIIAIKLTDWKQKQLNLIELLLLSCTFLLWMTPDFKVSDFFACIILLASFAYLIDYPSIKRYFLCGLIVGIAAIIGRNHGLYGIFGSIGAFCYLAWIRRGQTRFTAVMAWGLGVFIGYLPMLICLLVIPGFMDANIDMIRLLISTGSTNITKPWPRPWWAHFEGTPWIESSSEILTGIIFMLIPIIIIFSIGYLVLKRHDRKFQANPVFISSSLLMLPYAHYAFARADLVHLALGIFPFLFGIITFPSAISKQYRHSVIVVLFVVSVLTMVSSQAYYQLFSDKNKTEIVNINGDVLKVSRENASQITLLNELNTKFASNGRLFFSAPFWPGAYAVMQKKSPTWEIYFTSLREESVQQKEIMRIKSANIGFAVIHDNLLDNRKDLLFEATNPSIERYIRENYQLLPGIDPLLKVRVYVSRDEKSPL